MMKSRKYFAIFVFLNDIKWNLCDFFYMCVMPKAQRYDYFCLLPANFSTDEKFFERSVDAHKSRRLQTASKNDTAGYLT